MVIWLDPSFGWEQGGVQTLELVNKLSYLSCWIGISSCCSILIPGYLCISANWSQLFLLQINPPVQRSVSIG